MRDLAKRQHGVFARRQLVARGIGPKLVDRCLLDERIEAVHRSVYAFSRDLLSREGRWMAAVLAIGPGAVLSHGSAAALWGLRRPRAGPTHVTTPRKLSRRPGLALHFLPLARDEVTSQDGIPTTTPGRTLFDIAHVVSPEELEQAVRQADYLRLTDGPSLATLADRYPGRTGIRAVRRLVGAGWSEASTRSDLEGRFSLFIDKYNLPRPERNALIDLGTRQVEVDFLWRFARLVVELDGYKSHGSRHAFEDDRERDRLLQLAGFRVVRVTWRQLRANPDRLARDLGSLLRS